MPRAIQDYTLTIRVTPDDNVAWVDFTVHQDDDTSLKESGTISLADALPPGTFTSLRAKVINALRSAGKIPS